jgi:hypothetical protein
MLLRILLVVFCLAGAVAPAFAQEPAPEFAMAELTPETARRAFDAYLIIEAKFADAAFEEYDSLEDFVLRAPEGKELDAAIRAQGFAGVEAWLPIINSVEFTLGALTDNQEQAVLAQIEEVKADATLEADEKARIVASLEAAIPSDNNRKVLTEMMADPAYAEKLKSFTSEE